MKRIDVTLVSAGALLLLLQLILLTAILLRLNQLDRDMIATLSGLVSREQASSPPSRLVSEDDDPSLGSPQAEVVIVEFSDFECPYCAETANHIERLLQVFGNQVRVVYRDFPLEGLHSHAFRAAVAAECAHEQDKFWEMHDALFAHQAALEDKDLRSYARSIGLNEKVFSACLDSAAIAEEVRADQEQGRTYGVQGTPTVFINGLMLAGSSPLSTLEATIEAALQRQ